jgi:hypothetical protein
MRDKVFITNLIGIIIKLIDKLIYDMGVDEYTALMLVYQSNTYRQLSDEKSKLWWESDREIYHQLKSELIYRHKKEGVLLASAHCKNAYFK